MKNLFNLFRNRTRQKAWSYQTPGTDRGSDAAKTALCERTFQMTHKLFSIRDAKGDMFHPPFLQKTAGEAERTFTTLVKKPDTMFFAYPEDYDLYYLGEFDDRTGKMQLLDSPQHQIKAIHLLVQPGPVNPPNPDAPF